LCVFANTALTNTPARVVIATAAHGLQTIHHVPCFQWLMHIEPLAKELLDLMR
jgi:hypothetical protein